MNYEPEEIKIAREVSKWNIPAKLAQYQFNHSEELVKGYERYLMQCKAEATEVVANFERDKLKGGTTDHVWIPEEWPDPKDLNFDLDEDNREVNEYLNSDSPEYYYRAREAFLTGSMRRKKDVLTALHSGGLKALRELAKGWAKKSVPCKHEWDRSGEKCVKCGTKDWMT